MADMVNASVPANLAEGRHASPWTPLREPLFRSLWVAAVISYIGTWMQNVGAGWLMTQLTLSPLMVSLVQAASTLPVFLVILPAGALADMVDRRRLLLITQGWMVLAAALLGVFTVLGHVTPWILLLFTFGMGLGAVMNDPAWQAITPEIVSPQQFAPAVALNSVGFNVARAVGPAVGGLVIAMAGSGVAFMLNAASFFGVIFFLYRWRRPRFEDMASGSVREAILEGLRYARTAPVVRCVLIRTAAFSLGASSLLALLPILARPHGATGYGLLLGFFGLGALAGAAVLPQMRNRLSVDSVVAFAIIVFAAMTFTAGELQSFAWLSAALFVSGTAWIAILACLNVAAQTMSPRSLRARSLSAYLLVLQGGLAGGSALWGAVAGWTGVPTALMCSAAALVVGLLAVRRYRLTALELEFAPAVVRD
jgi:MFS family permease